MSEYSKMLYTTYIYSTNLFFYRKLFDNKWAAIVIGIFLYSGLFAQNDVPASLYAFDKYGVNSAYGGLTGSRILSVNIREQWVGLPGNPKYYLISYSQPVYRFHGGAGVKIKSEKHGVQDVFSLNLTYNYVFSGYYGLFSFGLGSGLMNIAYDNNKIVTPSGIYQNGNIDHNDGFLDDLLLKNLSFYNFNVFGIYNYGNIEFGIVFDKNILLNKNSLPYRFHDLLKVNWQYVFEVNKDIYLKIFGLIQSDFILLQTNSGFTADYKSILAGINLRGYSPDTFDALSIILGGNINSKFRIIYAYDISLTSLRGVEDGTHELKITYDFGNLKKNIKLPPVIFNPRL